MVEVTELTKQYRGFKAVDSVSFQIRAGETFALLGPNGSGKTTILKCLAGLVFATSGTMRIGGFDIRREPVKVKAAMSYLAQRAAFPENLTARELIHFYAHLRKLTPARIEWALQNYGFGVEDFIDQPVGEYSGGMVQRLAIVLALTPEVPLLILDEPAVNLDPEGAVRFRGVLQSLAAEGRTILFSSHRLSDVELLADRVAVLVGGKLVALDSVARLQSKLTSNVRLRISLKNPDAKYLDAVAAAGASELRLNENILIVSCVQTLRPAVLHAVERAGGEIESFSTDDATLEEVYLSYVNKNGGNGIDSSGFLPRGGA